MKEGPQGIKMETRMKAPWMLAVPPIFPGHSGYGNRNTYVVLEVLAAPPISLRV